MSPEGEAAKELVVIIQQGGWGMEGGGRREGGM